MNKVRIKQNKSVIGQKNRQKLTIEALGLGKINSTVEVELTPQIQGMINKVKHIVTVSTL